MNGEPANVECILIADDLTGACDTGVQFARRGLACRVDLNLASDRAPETADVLAFNTDSRCDSAAECRRKIEQLAAGCSRFRANVIFKKIDSTLRGNVGDEIAAALRAFKCEAAIIAPAFPAMGRVVRGGVLHWADCSGRGQIDIGALLAEQGIAPAAIVSLSAANLDLAKELNALLLAGKRYFILDSQSQNDLKLVATDASAIPPRMLWVGSAGLGKALADQMAKSEPRKSVPAVREAPMLFVIGSTHPASLRQKETLLKSTDVDEIEASCENIAVARRTLDSKRHLVVSIARETCSESSLRQFFDGLSGPRVAALFLTGGNTGMAVCKAIGAHSIDLRDEIVPGFPWGILDGGMFHGLPVASKAGGFGDKDALLGCVEFFAPQKASMTVGSGRPAIAVTIGDPAGIGPEVVLKALSSDEVRDLANWIIVGDPAALEKTARTCGVDTGSLPATIRTPTVIRDFEPYQFGQLNANCGRVAVEYVRVATDMCLNMEADAMVTAPLNKEAVTRSGMPFSGHTEYIAELCEAKDSRMMLSNGKLSVVHVTTHVSLRNAIEASTARILRTIELGNEAMKMLGCERPRIAMCGLNPHAGEHGLFGDEDVAKILPAIEAALSRGMLVDGPHAPDTIFLRAASGEYDLVVAMYHDQGHIAMKLIDFERTVNVSLGIPIIRTSVDHGTAFDIAGKNTANPQNMIAAMKMAAAMATRKSTRTKESRSAKE